MKMPLISYFVFSFFSILCNYLLINDLRGQNNSGTWIQKANMPTPRSHACSIVYGNEIYVIGGNNSGSVEVYSPQTNTWKIKKTFPGQVLSWDGIGLKGDKIYTVIGIGKKDTEYYIIAAYSPKNDNWEKIDSTKYAINDPAVTVLGNCIYFISGFYVNRGNTVDYRNVDTVKEYNIESKKWSFKTKIPTKRHAAATFALGSQIFVFGGISDCFCNPPSSSIEVFDIKLNKWTNKSNMIQAMAYSGNSCLGEYIYFVNQDLKQKIAVYNYKSDKWVLQSSKPYDARYFSQITYNNKIYLFGGIKYAKSPDNILNTVYEFTPTTSDFEIVR